MQLASMEAPQAPTPPAVPQAQVVPTTPAVSVIGLTLEPNNSMAGGRVGGEPCGMVGLVCATGVWGVSGTAKNVGVNCTGGIPTGTARAGAIRACGIHIGTAAGAAPTPEASPTAL